MKKSKLLIVGLIGVFMVLGVVVIGCEGPDKCDGKCFFNFWDENAHTNNRVCYIGADTEMAKCYTECYAHKAKEGKVNTYWDNGASCDCN